MLAFASRDHDGWAWLLAGHICQEIGTLLQQCVVPSSKRQKLGIFLRSEFFCPILTDFSHGA
ncbi:hypothetical protein [Acinetobacter bereziniae]|uniref:hypothetical protein n=1 Tax=Acinetobacter bereziniae TaxID=106648 RepID=UPI0012FD9EC7|nr:hypothetical protein [Acinetobacter bereziniae]